MSAAEMLAGAAPDPAGDWHSIDWKKVYRTVRRLQARIVKAVRAGRWGKVKALVYLLTHSFAGRALAILRVVTNSGARSPGVDGTLWNTPEANTAGNRQPKGTHLGKQTGPTGVQGYICRGPALRTGSRPCSCSSGAILLLSRCRVKRRRALLASNPTEG